MSNIKIHCDGSCFPNPGFGGYSVVISPIEAVTVNEKTVFFSGGAANVSNNKMELTACLEALKWLSEQGIEGVTIFSDSQYVVKTHNQWMHKHQRNGWAKKGGSIKNLDLIKLIYGLKMEVKSKMEWVRGHNGDPLNEFADQLAEQAREKITSPSYAKFDAIELQETVLAMAEKGYFHTMYRVNAKFITSDTIVLVPINNRFAKQMILSREQFDSKNLIKL